MASIKKEYRVTRHVCPRNCYDACGILAYVKNGRLVKVSGDPLHGYTRGKLCSKGYNYLNMVYNPDRLKYPLRQAVRGSGIWQKISWDEALEIICEKILDLKDRYGTTLPVCLNKYSGNFGLLHYAAEGMFNSLGPTTQSLGSPCWSAGLDAQFFDFGNNYNSDPEEMEKAGLIILWGVNPAWTAVHSLPYIFKAQEKGARVVVIDPIYTQTAKKADWYIQINPGSDGALALALAKIIWESGRADWNFLNNHTFGWPQFQEYLKDLDLDQAAAECGQELSVLRDLAQEITTRKPSFIWIGYGLQRHVWGGQNVRAINALGAIIGSIGMPGGGVQYTNLKTWDLFNYNFLKTRHSNRYININLFAHNLKALDDPPVKMLWVSCRNLLKQDADINSLLQQLKGIELIVTVDKFLTDTALHSDLVLPTTTFFEALDVVPSYWHHWLGINEKAIDPYYESKSDLEIAQIVTKTLNKYQAGSSDFPQYPSEEAYLDREFTDSICKVLGINHWTDLKEEPVKVKGTPIAWADKKFQTPSGKYEFYSNRALAHGLPAMPVKRSGLAPNKDYPYWLLTPHHQQGLNSQFQFINKQGTLQLEPVVYINHKTAASKGIKKGSMVEIFNDCGSIILKACLTDDTPPDTLVCYQGMGKTASSNLNTLVKGILTDMGACKTGSEGMAFYDVFVDFKVWRES